MIFDFIRKYPLAKVGCVVFCDFVFIFVCVRVVVYYRIVLGIVCRCVGCVRWILGIPVAGVA